MEDYKEKYEMALEKAKTLLSKCKCVSDKASMIYRAEDIENIFPELKESEGERTRKELLAVVNDLVLPDEQQSRFVAWLEKQREQKHVNKIEPKFHEGDWVVTDKGDTIQIRTVNNDYYTIGNRMLFSMSYVDTSWHLWTIKDAKDGDVLAGKIDGDNYVFIYKRIKDGWIETYGHYYDSVNRFCVPSQLFCREFKGTFRPATEKQRNLLFEKMKETGYKWNVNEKELIKL